MDLLSCMFAYGGRLYKNNILNNDTYHIVVQIYLQMYHKRDSLNQA